MTWYGGMNVQGMETVRDDVSVMCDGMFHALEDGGCRASQAAVIVRCADMAVLKCVNEDCTSCQGMCCWLCSKLLSEHTHQPLSF